MSSKPNSLALTRLIQLAYLLRSTKITVEYGVENWDNNFLQALDKIHDTFESDLEAANSRITLLETIAGELRDLHYVNSESVDTRLQGVRDTFTNLKEMSDGRKARIQDAIAAQQNLDSIRLDYAKKAAVSLLIVAQYLNTRLASMAWIDMMRTGINWYNVCVCVHVQ